MKASELFVEFRYDINDQFKARFSDFQLMNTLNSVLRLMNNALNNLFSPIIVTAVTLPITNSQGTLPTDYQSIVVVKITGDDTSLEPITLLATPTNEQYKIMSGAIYTNNSSVDIIYRKTFPKLSSADDDLPLPDYFIELIKKYMKALLMEGASKTDVSFSQMMSSDLSAIVTGNEYTYLQRELPFSF